MIKRSIFFLLLVFSTLSGKEVTYIKSYADALGIAQKQEKMIYVLIVSDNCKWCRKFEMQTLQDAIIKERVNKEFVTVLLSRDSAQIPKIFKTTPVPRHYFLDSKGKILYSAVGYRDNEFMNAIMDNAESILKQLQENE